MNRITQTLQHRHVLAICAAIFGLLAASETQAQFWHAVYGPDDDSETGMNRVAPVLGDCTSQQYGGHQGYIAVGSSYLTSSASARVYVVRTDDLGAVVWEKTYDINQDGLDDDGFSIVELSDGSGFAVTGQTFTQNGDHDVFIMKIDCQGSPVWVNTYGTIGGIEFGYDIIEAQSGDPTNLPIPTNAGDLIVAGEIVYIEPSPNPPGPINQDAYLLRVTSNGALIWDQAYDGVAVAPGAEHLERFHALTEASTVGTAVTGDIIAVGSTDLRDGSREQGLVARVDGNNGNFGGTPRQRAAHYGGSYLIDGDWLDDFETFTSVIELQNPNEQVMGVQNVAIVGYSYAKQHSEIYAVKLGGGDPCNPVVEELLGDLGTDTASANDEAWCVREIDWEMIGTRVSQWDLAITGTSDRNGDDDMFLITLDPATMIPVLGGIEQLYGTAAGEIELGRSLEPVEANGVLTDGFILCGTTYGDPQNVGDPSDMYLIKTGAQGYGSSTSNCQVEGNWVDESVAWSTCYTPQTMAWSTAVSTDVSDVDEETGVEICESAPKWAFDLTGLSEQVWFRIDRRILQQGESLYISGIRSEGEVLTVQVFDLMGRLVTYKEESASASSIEVDLGNAASGAYTVLVSDGQTLKSSRIRILR